MVEEEGSDNCIKLVRRFLEEEMRLPGEKVERFLEAVREAYEEVETAEAWALLPATLRLEAPRVPSEGSGPAETPCVRAFRIAYVRLWKSGEIEGPYPDRAAEEFEEFCRREGLR